MWLKNLKELKEQTKMSTRQISEKTNMPEKTIARVFSGHTEAPTITTLIPIINALGGDFTEIFADTQAVVSNTTVTELQESVEVVNAEKDLLLADYELLKEKYDTATKELEVLKKELAYTKKLLAVHEYYTKLKSE